jgi:hypothetical protein
MVRRIGADRVIDPTVADPFQDVFYLTDGRELTSP